MIQKKEPLILKQGQNLGGPLLNSHPVDWIISSKPEKLSHRSKVFLAAFQPPKPKKDLSPPKKTNQTFQRPVGHCEGIGKRLKQTQNQLRLEKSSPFAFHTDDFLHESACELKIIRCSHIFQSVAQLTNFQIQQ